MPNPTAVVLTSGTAANVTSQALASVSFAANKLKTLSINHRNFTGTAPPVPTFTGPLTWVQVATNYYDTGPTSLKRVTVFRALNTSGTSGVVTMDFAGDSQTDVCWSLEEWTDADATGTDGSGAIVQSVTAKDETGSATSITATLAAFSSADNSTYGAFGHVAPTNGATASAGSGFTTLTNNAAPQIGLVTMYKASNDTTVDGSLSGVAYELGMIAVEIKAAAASGIVGVATPTLAALTSSSAGALQIKGTSSPALAALIAVSASKLAIAGAGTPTLAALTVSATAVHTPITGAAAVTLDSVTTSSAGKVAIAGSASPTLAAVTSTSTGALPLAGTATPTLGAISLASVGTLSIKATSTPTLDPLTLSATGSLALAAGTGAVTQTLAALSASSVGKVALAATAAPTLGPLTSSVTAALTLKGSAGPTLAPVTLTAAGELVAPSVRVGTLNVTLGDILAGGTGQIKLAGVVVATLGGCSLSAFGRSGLFVESLARTLVVEAEDRVRAIESQNRRRIVSAASRGNPVQ